MVVKCVPCPAICDPALSVLSRLSPYPAPAPASNDRLPLSCVPVLATAAPDYQTSVSQLVSLANKEYQDFLQSEDGYGFNGQGVILCRLTSSNAIFSLLDGIVK